MNRNETEGKAKSIKGRARQAEGILTGNEKLESDGARERAAGVAQEQIGTASRRVREQIEDLGRRIQKRLPTGRT
jgi:uncharacterized protein YjbJ (UPF0337 family)